MPPKLCVLLDPSGAYLCLDNSLVCSHFESLLTRIRVTLSRGDRTVPVSEPAKLAAFETAPVVHEQQAWIMPYGSIRVEVRQTPENVIMPKAA